MTRTVAFEVYPLGAPGSWWPACPSCGEAEVGAARLVPLDASQCNSDSGTNTCRGCGTGLPQ